MLVEQPAIGPEVEERVVDRRSRAAPARRSRPPRTAPGVARGGTDPLGRRARARRPPDRRAGANQAPSPSQMGSESIQIGVPGTNTSGKTISRAPSAAASPTSCTTSSVVCYAVHEHVGSLHGCHCERPAHRGPPPADHQGLPSPRTTPAPGVQATARAGGGQPGAGDSSPPGSPTAGQPMSALASERTEILTDTPRSRRAGPIIGSSASPMSATTAVRPSGVPVPGASRQSPTRARARTAAEVGGRALLHRPVAQRHRLARPPARTPSRRGRWRRSAPRRRRRRAAASGTGAPR